MARIRPEIPPSLYCQQGDIAVEKNVESVLAIDPGRAKCGVAVVRRDGQILFRAIVAVAEIQAEAQRLFVAYRPCVLIVGGGTGSRPVLEALRAAELPVAVERVEEAHTSEAARARFVAENQAPGWQRFLPRSLRTPWRLYDDYVAIILAERYWQKQNSPSPCEGEGARG